MADTLIAPTSRRTLLRLPAQPSPRPSPVAKYARAHMLRLARKLADRAALKRAALRARAFEAVAADRLTTGRG
ncbi:hypothetical protein [Sphaerotilus sp.]|uniref:hypothetical protein n=1 Tax=Sphaerotilus sp. TaxID=2093942 RepID=UPI0025D74F4F|nr:hypothetical protein [Sphaerotilus sp.]